MLRRSSRSESDRTGRERATRDSRALVSCSPHALFDAMNRLKQSLSSISAPTMPSFGSLTSSSAAADRQTSPPLEQERLDQLAARQELSGALLDACSQLHRALAKERPDPRNTIAHGKTKLPVEWVALVMQEGAERINDSSTRSSPRELQDYGESTVPLLRRD